jgi:hypothetical protein
MTRAVIIAAMIPVPDKHPKRLVLRICPPGNDMIYFTTLPQSVGV